VYAFLPQFIVITYVLVVVWLLVFSLSAIPVYFFYNMANTCQTINFLSETPSSINQLCIDTRQYGNDPTMHSNSLDIRYHSSVIILLMKCPDVLRKAAYEKETLDFTFCCYLKCVRSLNSRALPHEVLFCAFAMCVCFSNV